MYVIEASQNFQEHALKVPIPIKELQPLAGRQIWTTPSSPSSQETALFNYFCSEFVRPGDTCDVEDWLTLGLSFLESPRKLKVADCLAYTIATRT